MTALGKPQATISEESEENMEDSFDVSKGSSKDRMLGANKDHLHRETSTKDRANTSTILSTS